MERPENLGVLSEEDYNKFVNAAYPEEDVKFSLNPDSGNVFERDLARMQNGEMRFGELLHVSQSPEVLKRFGAPDYPLKMSQDKVKKLMLPQNAGGHGLDAEVIKELPVHLADPVMVFESATQPDSLVFLTELHDVKNNPVIAAVHIDKKLGDVSKINVVASAYGKKAVSNFIKNNMENKRLKYLNTEKSRNWFAGQTGLQLPGASNQNDSSINSILTEKDVVNRSVRYSLNKNAAKEQRNNNGVQFSVPVNGQRVPVVSGNVRPEIKRFMRRTGAQLRFVDMDSSVNGFYHDGVAHVNVNSSKSFEWVAGHEFAHYMEQHHKDILRSLAASLKVSMTEVRNIRKVYAAKGIELSNDEAIAEFVADRIGDRWADARFWEQFKRGNPSLWQRIVNVLRRFARSIFSTAEAAEIEKGGLSPEKLIGAMREVENRGVSQRTELAKNRIANSLRSPVQSIEDVRARYEGTSQWLKAPNGKPSKLNERQWLQVRTPEFKRWFGDWELADFQNEFDSFVDDAIVGDVSNGEFALRLVSDAEVKEVLKQTDGQLDISGMQHVLSAQWVKHALKTHGAVNEIIKENGNQRALTVDDIKRIPEILDSYDGLTVQLRGNNRTSIIYSKKLNDGTIEYVERVFETSQKKSPRLVTKTAWVKTPTGASSSLPRVYTPERNVSLPFSNGRVNADGVSKVVDANGEPLVVYHGTGKKFNEFRHDKLGSREHAFFFTSNEKMAREYGGEVVSAYLNIKHLADVDSDYNDVHSGAAINLQERNHDYDGFVIDRNTNYNEWAVYDSNNIKSATANIGTFDANNPDIRYSVASDAREEVKTAARNASEKLVEGYRGAKDFVVPYASNRQGAREATQSFREKLSESERRADQMEEALKKIREAMQKLPKAERWELVRKYEVGEPLGEMAGGVQNTRRFAGKEKSPACAGRFMRRESI